MKYHSVLGMELIPLPSIALGINTGAYSLMLTLILFNQLKPLWSNW